MLLKNGIVTSEYGTRKLDVRVGDGVIHGVGERLVPVGSEEVVDCGGKFLLPGGVDVHTHLDCLTSGDKVADDLYTGTVAAAFGGTTTVINHISVSAIGGTIRAQLEYYRRMGDQSSVLDYGLHGIVDHVDEDILEEVGALVEVGVTSFKLYLTGRRKLGGSDILRLMERAGALGAMTMVHAEEDSIIRHRMGQLQRQGKTAPIHHAQGRPVASEALGVQWMLTCAAVTGHPPLYLCHITNGRSIEAIQYARALGGKHIFAETCPQYLLLDEGLYQTRDGHNYMMCPPLRPARDREALWRGLEEGLIDTVASDHSPFLYREKKQAGQEDLAWGPGGIPGVEERMPLMFHLVGARGLGLPHMVRMCCAEPARLFGLYPRKGVIAPGSDADLVVVDPAASVTLSADRLHGRSGYTAYEGMALRGYPSMVMSRGRWIVREGQFLGQKGQGRFLHRGLPDLSQQGNDRCALDN